MAAYKTLGEFSPEIFSRLTEYFGVPQTHEIVVTDERAEHIRGRHPQDFTLFQQYGADCVQAPDFVIEDYANRETVFLVKKLPETNLNVVIRLALEEDERHPKNSVMTFYRIRERNLRKLIQKNNLLYKKE